MLRGQVTQSTSAIDTPAANIAVAYRLAEGTSPMPDLGRREFISLLGGVAARGPRGAGWRGTQGARDALGCATLSERRETHD
jgi:hypothetical protein